MCINIFERHYNMNTSVIELIRQDNIRNLLLNFLLIDQNKKTRDI